MASERQTKFIQEFTDDQNKVIARWHYDRDKFPNGPILTEDFSKVEKQKTNKTKKNKSYEVLQSVQ